MSEVTRSTADDTRLVLHRAANFIGAAENNNALHLVDWQGLYDGIVEQFEVLIDETEDDIDDIDDIEEDDTYDDDAPSIRS